MKNNKFQIVNLKSINKETDKMSIELQAVQSEFEEILNSGVSKRELLNMIEYDYEIFRKKELDYAKAASLSKDECIIRRNELDNIQTVIKSDEEAIEKVLALKLM